VKTNIQSSKNNEKKSLNLKQACFSSALKQCQSGDFSYSSITGFKRVTLFTALALGLIGKPYLAHAEISAGTLNLQTVAETYAQERSYVLAQDHWTRIEFGTTYIDPVVVVEASTVNVDNSYVVGIRNVDATGFEIGLKNCNNSTGIPVQEDVNYAVIDKSQLPSTKGAGAKIRQQFSWGQCATQDRSAYITTRIIL
jgi:hypothetical protein